MSLIVTGTIGIDTVYTPSGHAERVLGGSCTYFAAAASFFTPVRLVAAVGDDFPKEHRAILEHFKGIDLAGLETRKGSKTFAWGGKYLANMNSRETLFTELGVLAEHPPRVPESFAHSRHVFLANTHPAVQLGMIEQLPHRVLTVADTMDLWINIAKPELLMLLKEIDGIVLNYDEAELLTGKSNPVTAGRHILDLGPSFVVIKKGEHGALLVHKDGSTHGTLGFGLAALPAYPTEKVVDPTGAGDTFAGGMMGYLSSTGSTDAKKLTSYASIRTALAFGTVAASFNIESYSLERLKTLKRSEIDQRLREYEEMTRIG